MGWTIKFIPNVEKQIKKIPHNDIKRIFNYLKEKVSLNPKAYGKALKGSLHEFWRYRVGDYRIIAKIEDNELIVLVVRIEHRKKVYKTPINLS